jgi:hypothetical protein
MDGRAAYRQARDGRRLAPLGVPHLLAGEIRTLIRRMAAENAGWGALKIHGEFLTLGFVVSQRTVGK